MNDIFGIKVRDKKATYEKMLMEADGDFLYYILSRKDFNLQFKDVLFERFIKEIEGLDHSSADTVSHIIMGIRSEYFNKIFDQTNCEKALKECVLRLKNLEEILANKINNQNIYEYLTTNNYRGIEKAVFLRKTNLIEHDYVNADIEELCLKIHEVIYFIRSIITYGDCTHNQIMYVVNSFIHASFFMEIILEYSFSSRRNVSKTYFEYYLDNLCLVKEAQSKSDKVNICPIFAIGEMINYSQDLPKECILKASHVLFNESHGFIAQSKYYSRSEVIVSIYAHKSFDKDIHNIIFGYDPIESVFAMFYKYAGCFRSENYPDVNLVLDCIDAISYIDINNLMDSSHERYSEFLGIKDEIRAFLDKNISVLTESDYLRLLKNMF